MKRKQPRNAKQEAFLAAYVVCGGHVGKASKASRVGRSTYYEWKNDSEFLDKLAIAHEDACELFEVEADRRAIDGERKLVLGKDDKPVFVWVDKNGEPVREGSKKAVREVPLYETRRSDPLIMFRLKALKPEVYRERFDHHLAGKSGGPLTLRIVEEIIDANPEQDNPTA